MRSTSLSWILVSLAVGGLACSSGSGQSNDGGAGGKGGGGAATGRGGTGGGGRGGSSGAAGSSGVAGTSGVAGASGGTGGNSGTAGNGGAAGTSAGGTGGSSGTAGTSAGGTGGNSGTAGTGAGGRGGSGAASGNGGALGSGGTGGRGGAGGTGGGAGTGGTGGTAGAGGGAGTGSAGTAGTGSALRVTHAEALPNFQGNPLLVVVDGQDTAVVVGPSAQSLSSEDPGPRVTWIPRQGAPHSATFANAITPLAIAVDPSRNVWLAGQLSRSVTFGGPTLPEAGGGYYLVALASEGTHVSSHAVRHTGNAWVRNAVTDPQGNVYVVGTVSSLTIPSTDSVFVTKFSPAGVEIWNSEFPSQGSSASATDVAVAPNGEVVIVGWYNSQLQIGTTTLTLPTGSIDTGFFAALDPDTGAARRAMRFGGPDFDVGNSIEVTSTGALRISGLVSGAATIGGMNIQADPIGSAFVAELTAAGAANWVKLVAGQGHVFAADTNSADRTFAVGYLLNASIREAFVASVVPGGTLTLPLRTTTAYDTNGAQFAAADRHGGVWVTGDFKGTVNFGTGPLNAAGPDMFGDFLVHLEP